MCEAITEVTSGEAEHELINVYDTSAYSLTFCFTNELGLFLRIIKIIHGCEFLIKPELHQCLKFMFAFRSKSESMSLYPETQEWSQLQNSV